MCPLILPAESTTAPQIEAFFSAIGANRRRSTYRQWLDIFGSTLARGIIEPPREKMVAHMGWTSRDAAYRAMSEKDAHLARADTERSRRSSLRWLGGQKPLFVLVQGFDHQGRQGAKAAVALMAGMLPFAIVDARHADDVVARILRDVREINPRLPLIGISTDSSTFELLLDGSTRMIYDCLTEIDPFYQPTRESPIRLIWGGPSVGDQLSVADMVHQVGEEVGEGRHYRLCAVTIRSQSGGQDVGYVACGPIRGRYWLQRRGTETLKETARVLLVRVAAIIGCDELTLDGWPTERLAFRTGNGDGARRMEHVMTLSSMLPLHQNLCSPSSDSSWTDLVRKFDGVSAASIDVSGDAASPRP